MTTELTTPTVRVRLTRLLGSRLRLIAEFPSDSDRRAVLNLVTGVLEQTPAVLSDNTPGKRAAPEVPEEGAG